MKTSSKILAVGIIMIVAGSVAFTATQDQPNSEMVVKIIKQGGAFAGLLGIGVSIAGVLLYIINRYQVM